MSYTLYTDKNENFECEVSVKNASLKGSLARLIVESDDGPCFIFKGIIQGDKCVIPIKRLKGLLDENDHGKMHLELVVEDTYFKPWESQFIVEEHTSIKVRVNEQKQPSNKPIVELKTIKIKKHPLSKHLKGNTNEVLVSNKKGINVYTPKKEIATICERFGIRKNNFRSKQKDLAQILKEYFKSNPEYKNHARTILTGIRGYLK